MRVFVVGRTRSLITDRERSFLRGRVLVGLDRALRHELPFGIGSAVIDDLERLVGRASLGLLARERLVEALTFQGLLGSRPRRSAPNGRFARMISASSSLPSSPSQGFSLSIGASSIGRVAPNLARISRT